MRSRYSKDSEYYLVKGSFERTGGMHQGRFYGACYTNDNPLTPVRVVLEGVDAAKASEMATKNASENGILSYAILEGKKHKKKHKKDKKHKEDIERDDEKVIDEEPQAPSDLTAKDGDKKVGEDRAIGDLKTEGTVSEMKVAGDNIDIPDDGPMAQVASNPEKKQPKDENKEALEKFFKGVGSAIHGIEDATQAATYFGFDNQILAELKRAQDYLVALREKFVKSQGNALKVAGINVGGPVAEDIIKEMTGTGAIADFPGKQGNKGEKNTGLPKDTQKFGSPRKKKKETAKEDVDGQASPLTFAKQPLESNLGLNSRKGDKGKNKATDRADGLKPAVRESLDGKVLIAEPDKLATLNQNGEPVEECARSIGSIGIGPEFKEPKLGKKLRKKAAKSDNKPVEPMRAGLKPKPKQQGVQEVPGGAHTRARMGEDIEVGSRVELSNILEEQFKYMNGLRGKVIALDQSENPVKIKLDDMVYADDDGTISVRPDEIVIIKEDENKSYSEAMEMAREIAQGCGVKSESAIRILGNEIMEWATTNAIEDVMSKKEELLPVFQTLLSQIHE